MLDFSTRPKKYFDIALHDGTSLQIPTPTMAVYESMKEISKKANDADASELSRVVTEILNTNKKQIKITDEQIQTFDLEDMYELFFTYVEFVKEVLSAPNSESLIAP